MIKMKYYVKFWLLLLLPSTVYACLGRSLITSGGGAPKSNFEDLVKSLHGGSYKDIGYSFLVGQDARIYEGRGWGVVGGHTEGNNTDAYGVAFIGDYRTSLPERAALKAAKALIECGIEKGMISPSYRLYGHRDAKPTEYPGDKLYNEIKKWKNFAGGSSVPDTCSSTDGPDTACTCQDGRCQDVSETCPGGYKPGLCSGDADRRCCLPDNDPDSACTSQDGNCQKDSQPCDGEYKSGLCGGDAYNRCCLPRQGGVPDPTTTEAPEISDGGVPDPTTTEAPEISDGSACDRFELVDRSEWEAVAPKSFLPITGSVRKVFIHHTVGNKCTSKVTCSSTVRNTQTYHMSERNYNDIGYSFLVGEDGRIYEGRGWNVVGSHTKDYNSISYGISFMGNYNFSVPGGDAISAAKNLIACGIEKDKITPDYVLQGHRDVNPATWCPGAQFHEMIKGWPHYGPDFACTSRTGICQDENKQCAGVYKTGLCSGDASRKCCVPSQGGTPPPPTTEAPTAQSPSTEAPTAPPPSTEAPTAPPPSVEAPTVPKVCYPTGPDADCSVQDGQCQVKSEACAGRYQAGWCSGAANIQCCLPYKDQVLTLTDEELTKLEERLEADEGVSYTVYNDSRGFLTFGIGHKITENDPEHGKPIGTPVEPRERVSQVFKEDVQTVLTDVCLWSNDCNQWPSEVKLIIANMMFNMGRPTMNKFKCLRAAVRARNWDRAADEMFDSDWREQVKGRATRLIGEMRNVGN